MRIPALATLVLVGGLACHPVEIEPIPTEEEATAPAGHPSAPESSMAEPRALDLVRDGATVDVDGSLDTAALTWLRGRMVASPPQLRRRITIADWDEVLASTDRALIALPMSGGSEPWGMAESALLPLSPHPWAGWLLLREGDTCRSPFTIGPPPATLGPLH